MSTETHKRSWWRALDVCPECGAAAGHACRDVDDDLTPGPCEGRPAVRDRPTPAAVRRVEREARAESPGPGRTLAAAIAARTPRVARVAHPSSLELAILLWAQQAPAHNAEIARGLGWHTAGISEAVARLVARGLVVNTPAPDDRRRHTVALTAVGMRLLASARPK